MAHEAPTPEQEGPPGARFFNVDAMSDEQIVMTYRGYWALETSGGKDTDIVEGLFKQIAADMRNLASRDPERLKAFVARCAQSKELADQDLAVGVVPSLASYDYAFTRDTLVSLRVGSTVTADYARSVIPDLMRDYLTREQIDDFNARLAQHGDWYCTSPSPPVER